MTAASGQRERFALAAAAVALFTVLCTIYALSVPASFNSRYRNRNLFDSDCEFIPRQFTLHKTYTHNDHLLYHVTASALYRLTDQPPADEPYDSVPQHRWMGIVAGALGVTLLFLFGVRLGAPPVSSLALALFAGGCAGWWFFSATIDTYVPHLCAAVAALGTALIALETQSLAAYAALGASCGLAFLLRTDGFLLATLGAVAFAREPLRAPRRLLAAGAAGLLVGVGGYEWLAHAAYGVALHDVPRWALGYLQRGETQNAEWGSLANLTFSNCTRVLANHVLYAVLLPALKATSRANSVVLYAHHLPALAVYAAALGLAFCAGLRDRRFWWMGLGLAWISVRVVFYAWWDPAEPFLFAVLSLPGLWLLLLPLACARGPRWIAPAVLLLAAGSVWWHNHAVLILPLQ